MPPNPQLQTTAHNHKSQTHRHHPKSHTHNLIEKGRWQVVENKAARSTWHEGLRIEVGGKLWRTRRRDRWQQQWRTMQLQTTIWFWSRFGRTHRHRNPPPKPTKIQTHQNHPIPKSQPTPPPKPKTQPTTSQKPQPN